jgi:site-specific recombinase XerC
VLIVDACEAFIQNCGTVRKLSEHTTRAYRLDLNRFAGFAGVGAEIKSCDRATLQQYIEHLFTQHNLKETFAKRHVASLRPSSAGSRMRAMFRKTRSEERESAWCCRSAFGASSRAAK